jgi:AcrR family transcriptional regulator
MSAAVVTYDRTMVRWEPNARGRLEVAALQLYREHGFDQTTVAEIAARAGLTERTFFRHFADKREVLFGGSLEELFTSAITDAPAKVAPIDAVAAALRTGADLLQERREFALNRQAVIAVNPALQERELIKLAALGSAMAAALRARGVPEPAASLGAEAGIAVFRVAFVRWIDPANAVEFAAIIDESLAELKALTAGPGRRRPATA